MITALLAAKIQKGTAMPGGRDDQAAERRPGGAPTLKPTPFKAVALSSSSLGTRSGVVDPQASEVNAPAHAQQEGRRQQKHRRREVQRHQTGENHGDRKNCEFDRDQ